ncbi:uncharacterized protein LOC126896388 isoform X2 [Daktulosphaira vitifoliae]|uniref:uncharacterized protein LOC126896388 isoform X2 n=1 Tax=Daktulosphaira vitifoliae TaxID=58002 RepID=UPI0021AA5C51|nr:uncharacterized protein LOC126896388 isoform X2 [Daktulosphaira vitifoliae]
MKLFTFIILNLFLLITKSNTKKCLVCDNEESDVAILPCKHELCFNCASLLKKAGFPCNCGRPVKKIVIGSLLKEVPTLETITEKIEKDNKVCSVCQDSEDINVLVKPCGHYFCENCAGRLKKNNLICPLCRTPLLHFVGIIGERKDLYDLQTKNLYIRAINNQVIELQRHVSQGILKVLYVEIFIIYAYLIPGQCIDDKLLTEFKYIKNNPKLNCAKLYKYIKKFNHNKNDSFQKEQKMREKYWKFELEDVEKNMLIRYYLRNKLDVNKTLSLRDKYSKTLRDEY